MIAGTATLANGASDPLHDRIGLVRTGRQAQELDRTGRRLRPAEGCLGSQSLVDPLSCLEPLRVVVLDQPVGGVQDLLPAAEVLGEHHARRSRIGRPESQDVRERGPPKAIDALVVVAHHGHVCRRRPGQQLHHLELGVVGVLELVDQDVPIPSALRGEDGWMLSQQAERQADLIPEVDPIPRAHQPLIRRVRRRQLHLLRGFLLHRGVVRGGGRLGQLMGGGLIGGRRDVLISRPAEERGEGP